MRNVKLLAASLLFILNTGVAAQDIDVLWTKQVLACSWGLATGTDDSVYCIDAFEHGVFKFDTDGNLQTNWGSAGVGAGEFQGPRGVAADSNGHVYVTDSSSSRIQSFTPDGTFEKMWGADVFSGAGVEVLEVCSAGETCYAGLPSPSGFTYPHDVTVDPRDDTLVIADTVAARVMRLDPLTNELTELINTCESGECKQVLGVVVDSNGSLYLTTLDSNELIRFDFDTESAAYIQTWARILEEGSPPAAHYVALDSLGNVFVTDPKHHRVHKYSPDGTSLMVWGWGVATGIDQFEVCLDGLDCLTGIPWGWLDPENPGQFNGPHGIAVDSDNNILVVDDGGRLQKFGINPDITPPGEDVVVQPQPVDENLDPIEDAPPISFTFEDIESGGETTVVFAEPGTSTTSPPPGFKVTGLTGAPVLFAIETTATLAPGSTFEVCFDYSGLDVAGDPEKLTIMHEVDGKWIDIKTSNDTINMIICGTADSFSYFAILEPLAVVGPVDPIAVGIEAILGIDVGDPALTDTVRWQWGDGSSTDVAVTASEVVTGHVYTQAGVFAVTATLLQGDVESGSADFQYVIVYDPNGRFVTGGGWINSPVGACSLATCTVETVGVADFGFSAKYKKGANVPGGNIEFQFMQGDLYFKSLAYDWLVVAGARAQLKGTGTINDVGDFGFLLTVVDAKLLSGTELDLFRIKIWDMDLDAVIYDNSQGTTDTGDLTTAIGRGSIVIHKVRARK